MNIDIDGRFLFCLAIGAAALLETTVDYYTGVDVTSCDYLCDRFMSAAFACANPFAIRGMAVTGIKLINKFGRFMSQKRTTRQIWGIVDNEHGVQERSLAVAIGRGAHYGVARSAFKEAVGKLDTILGGAAAILNAVEALESLVKDFVCGSVCGEE